MSNPTTITAPDMGGLPEPEPDIGMVRERPPLFRTVTGFLSRYSMFVALVIVVITFAFTTDGVILRDQNISNVIVQNGYILVLAIGMVMAIIGGHIDLSVGSIAGFIGALAAMLAVNMELPWWLAVMLALAAGAAAGAFQGFWVAYVGIPSFIVTLAGMLIFRGLTLALIGSTNIGGFPDSFVAIGSGFVGNPSPDSELDILTVVLTVLLVAALVISQIQTRRKRMSMDEPVASPVWFAAGLVVLALAIGGIGLALARYRGTPNVLVILLVITVVYMVVMRRTPLGRHIYAVGGNRRAAELSGINAKRVDFFLFVNMGLLAALAGIIFTARLDLASSAGGTGFELEAIAAGFVGGAAVQGGTGTIGGAIVGGLTIGIINNGMSIMGLGAQWQQTVLGLVVLLVVAFDVWNKRRRGAQTV